MNKSISKIIVKAMLITLGVLLLFSGIFAPLTYYIGSEATATADNVSFTEREDGLYDINIRYHYFVSGREYERAVTMVGEYDETISLTMHSVKYLPFLPMLGILTLAFSFPLKSIVIASFGIIFLLLGLLLKTTKKAPKQKAKETPVKKAFVCPACLKEVDSDSIYCNYCGRKILYKD